jgi:hypothetical protein
MRGNNKEWLATQVKSDFLKKWPLTEALLPIEDFDTIPNC